MASCEKGHTMTTQDIGGCTCSGQTWKQESLRTNSTSGFPDAVGCVMQNLWNSVRMALRGRACGLGDPALDRGGQTDARSPGAKARSSHARGGKGYPSKAVVAHLRKRNIAGHSARMEGRKTPGLDARTTRHGGYAISQRAIVSKRFASAAR
jgi:hypothetical protein